MPVTPIASIASGLIPDTATISRVISVTFCHH